MYYLLVQFAASFKKAVCERRQSAFKHAQYHILVVEEADLLWSMFTASLKLKHFSVILDYSSLWINSDSLLAKAKEPNIASLPPSFRSSLMRRSDTVYMQSYHRTLNEYCGGYMHGMTQV